MLSGFIWMPGCSYLPDFRSCCRVPPPAWWERRSSTHAPAAAMQWSCVEAQRIRLHGMPPFFGCRFAISIRRQQHWLRGNSQFRRNTWSGRFLVLLPISSPFACEDCEVLVRPFRIFPMKESHHKSWKNMTKNPTSDDCWGFTFAGLKRRFTLCGFVWNNIDGMGMGQAVKDLGMTDLDRFGLFHVVSGSNPVLLRPNCEHTHISRCLINLSQIW